MPRIFPDLLRRYLPILTWGAEYSRRTLANDLIVAGIVTVMLIPQSLAYALLAGLPTQVGLYASMAPLVLYAIFGTSRTLAVGPVAVASLMTAAAAGTIATQGTQEYLGAAIALALISGLLLLAMGVLQLGFLADFLSHPVISGFITASGIQIAAGQLAPVLGIHAEGESLVDLLKSMVPKLGHMNPHTAVIGFASLAFLFSVRRGLKPLLRRFGFGGRTADILAKMGPIVAIAATTAAVWGFRLTQHGVKIVGTVPRGLPRLTLPPLNPGLWTKILVPALLISIVGYVESISVALTLAAKRRQRVDPDQELIALGALKRTYSYSRTDFAAMLATILLTLLEGVEMGLLAGVGLSIFLHLYSTSRPHVAVVGQIPGTAHFRNVKRHTVVTHPEILSLRVDESLYFPNARFLEDLVNEAVAANPAIRHVILECPAVNTIDASVLESLEAINHRLKDGGITFHLSEVKGPVMDRLKRSHFLAELTGMVHLTQYDAVSSINADLGRRTLDAQRLQ